jgi:Uma2 family endonuclease
MVVAAPKLYTPEDLLTMPDGDRYELVDGQLVERNVSALSSLVANKISTALENFAGPSKFGWVFPDNTSFQIFRNDPTRVRKVDAGFIALGRMSLEQINSQGHISVVPDLVVEVISPNDLAYEVNLKTEEWLKAGVQVVWVIDPEIKVVYVNQADGGLTKLGVNADLTADDVLPVFRCPVASLFPAH